MGSADASVPVVGGEIIYAGCDHNYVDESGVEEMVYVGALHICMEPA